MQESKRAEPDRKRDETGTGSTSRQADATSKETLSDVETVNSEGSKGQEPDKSSSMPSPDGQFDAERSGRDDIGPM